MNCYEPDPLGPFDMPMSIEVIENEVVFIGPGPIAFSMTIEAAQETERRLARILASRGARDS